jgi:hypothetical protein
MVATVASLPLLTTSPPETESPSLREFRTFSEEQAAIAVAKTRLAAIRTVVLTLVFMKNSLPAILKRT